MAEEEKDLRAVAVFSHMDSGQNLTKMFAPTRRALCWPCQWERLVGFLLWLLLSDRW